MLLLLEEDVAFGAMEEDLRLVACFRFIENPQVAVCDEIGTTARAPARQ